MNSASNVKPAPVVAKLLLLGDSGVGKSSIMSRFSDNYFDENMLSTSGVDFKSREWQVDDQRLKLTIWDTAGQERFRTITKAYYRGADGIILVYDITDMKTFKNIEYWMQNITAHASSHVEKFLVANKLDMEANRRVPTQRGVELAAEYGIPFIEVSAKADVGIGAAFDTVARALLARKAQRHADERERERERATVDLPTKDAAMDSSKCCSI